MLVLHVEVASDSRVCHNFLKLLFVRVLDFIAIEHRNRCYILECGLKSASDHDILLEKFHVTTLSFRVRYSLALLNGLRVMSLALMSQMSSASPVYGVFFASVVRYRDALAPDAFTLGYRVNLREDVLRLGVVNGRVVHPEGLVFRLVAWA